MSSSATEPVEPPIPRERGWGKVVLATLAFLLLPLTPLLRVVLPVERTALLIAPMLAGLAIAGWLAGGRPALAILWVGVAAWSMAQLAGAGLFALLQGGWTLLVAAAFAAVVASRRNGETPFLPRALLALGLAFGVALAVTFVAPSGASQVAESVAIEAGRRAELSRTGWREMTAMPQWQEFASRNAGADSMSKLVEQQLNQLPSTARTLFPSLAMLEALIALALAWALYHRIGRARLGPPLGSVRTFRFNDHLVWGVVGGLGLILIPGMPALRAIGANLLVFFGALYTVRGIGVLMWMLSPGRLAMAALAVLAVMFWSVLGVIALGVGVGDTWFDWRSRPRQQKA